MRSHLARPLRAGCFWIWALASVWMAAATAAEPALETALQALAPSSNQPDLHRFYEARGYTPAWLENGRPTPQAAEAVSLLERAPEKGLSSADYDTSRLAVQLADLWVAPSASTAELASFDVELTAAMLRYTTDLAHGRIDPRSLYLDLETDSRNVDVVTVLQQGIEQNRSRRPRNRWSRSCPFTALSRDPLHSTAGWLPTLRCRWCRHLPARWNPAASSRGCRNSRPVSSRSETWTLRRPHAPMAIVTRARW